MSLTWMEIQSAYMPIELAQGTVLTAGLGLGYYPLRAAADEDVDKVVVYEIEPRIIQFFSETFGGRPEFQKIEIRQGNVRTDLSPEEQFDVIFMDVYRTLLPDEVIADIKRFRRNVDDPMDYRFWGLEAVLLDAIVNREPVDTTYFEREFFRTWQKTPLWETEAPDNRDERDDTTLDQMYDEHTDEEYRYEVLSELGRV